MAKKKRVSVTRHEMLDDTPVAIPMKFRRVQTQAEKMREIIRQEMSRAAENSGMETWEEADDFSIDDEYDPTSPYELSIDQELNGVPDPDEGSPQGEESPPREGSGENSPPVQPGEQTPSGSPSGSPGNVSKAG